MGITYKVDSEHNELHTVAEGPIILADVHAHLTQEKCDLLLPCRELIDARRAQLQLSASDVREIVAWLQHASISQRLGPTAVVVSTDFAYGMIRMLQMLVEHVAVVQPFRDLEEALRWLQPKA